jgi:hypothetical protein
MPTAVSLVAIQPQRCFCALGKDHIAIQTKLTAPARHFIEHGIAKAQEMLIAIEVRRLWQTATGKLRFNAANPPLRSVACGCGR